MPPEPQQFRSLEPDSGSFTKLSGRGWGLLVMALLAALAGYMLPESALLHLGLGGLLLLAASRPLARWNLRCLTAGRTTPASAFAGHLFPVTLELHNSRRKLDAIAIDCEDSIGGSAERGLHAGWVKAGSRVKRKFQTRLLRRGVRHRLRTAVESTFPFGLWKVREESRQTLEMTIFPRPIVPRILDDPEFASLLEADEAESIQYDYAGDFHGLREFQPGDRIKHIDWPATARSGKIMVRQYDKRLPSRFLTVFHSFNPGRHRHGEAFESAMEMLCGLLLHLHGQHIPVDLAASFNGWRVVSMGSREEDLQSALRLLAEARRTPEADLSGLRRVLDGVDSSQRVFVLSDVPVKEWEAHLPELPCLVTCLSVSDLRLKQPRIVRRSLPQPEIPAPA
ncbi:MAG: DUF58 domain-containing protein [Verrucomicrobiales bacterium]|nr:DUF58 domain-containing protein [Verrucomicrobiales bacterium]